MARTVHIRQACKRFIGLVGAILLLSAAWGVLGRGTALAQTSPLEIQKQQIAAINRGDVAGVMALFTPDASYEAGNCIPKACVGTVFIRAEITREVAEHLQITVLSATASGTNVTGAVSITGDPIRAVPGVQRILAIFLETTRNDLVASVITKPELTDTQTLTFIKAKAAAQNPAALAFTGVDSIPLLLGGLLLVLTGAVLVRVTRRDAVAHPGT